MSIYIERTPLTLPQPKIAIQKQEAEVIKDEERVLLNRRWEDLVLLISSLKRPTFLSPESFFSASFAMALAVNGVRVLSAAVVDGFSHVISRRAFSAAVVQGVPSTRSTVGGTIMSGKVSNKSSEGAVQTTEKVSWVPDPKTGYYRPENTEEVDVADLRALLLGRKSNN